MSLKPSFMNPFARGYRKSDTTHWARESLDPLDSPLDATPSCDLVSNHAPVVRPPIAGSFLDMHTTGTSQAPVASAAHARRYRDVGVQTGGDDDSSDPTPPRRGSSMFREAGRILFGKKFGWKSKRAPVSPPEAQPPPPPPHLRPAVPQRPPRTEGLVLDSEIREWGRRMINDALYAHSPVASPLLASPFVQNLVAFPRMEDSAEEASIHDEVSKAQPEASRPLLPSHPYSLFSVATPPSSTSPSAYGSSNITSQSSAPSSSALSKLTDRVETIGVSCQEPDYAQVSEARPWPVCQNNLIRIPPLKEGKWVTAGVLGTGGFARVYHVFNVAIQKPCALKVVRFGRGISVSACAGIVNELKVLSLLASDESPSLFLMQPCLSDKLWAWRSSFGNLHIATELCDGGSLATYRYRIAYESLVLASAEIISGLNWLHQHGIVHHDLKPHNVLVTGSGHCVIADYGGARFLDGDGKLLRGNNSSIVMTTSFAAPEILEPLEDGDVREYDESADYWSLGATLITMFMPDEFLPGSSDMGLMAFRVEKIKDEMGHKGAPAELQAFVMDLLCMDPAQRCTYPEIKKQRIFQRLDWRDVESQAQPAIAPRDLACDAHGWEFPIPGVHKSRESTADFLEELRAHQLSLEVDDSYDVDDHHAYMNRCLSGRIVPRI